MEPRLSTSRKWTALPQELVTQIRGVFKQSFKDHIGQGRFETTGRIYPGEILMDIGYTEDKKLKQSHFQVSIAYQLNKDNVLKLLHLAVDASASLFEQFFAAADDTEFPRLWEEVKFEGRSLYVQYSTLNTTLEAEADRLLGEAEAEGLTQGEWSADEDGEAPDPEALKKKLGLVDD